MKSELVPGIRFGEFEGAWRETSLGNIASNVMYGLNRAATQFDGENKYIRITDIDDSTGRFIPSPLTSPEKPYSAEYQVVEGDILVARTGASTGRSYIYAVEDGKLYFAGFLIKIHIRNANPYFVYNNFDTANYRKWVGVMSMRSGQPGLNAREYKSFKINLPTLPEQQKIAAFLTAVDGRLAGLRRQVAALKRYKRGVMQGVFGDEVGGEWIGVKVGKAYSFFSTNSLSRAKLNYETGECKNIHYGDIHTQFSQYLNVQQTTLPYITPGVAMKGAAYKHPVQAGDVLLADASEDIDDIGKATEVVDAGNVPLYAGLHTIHARPKQGTIAPGFGTLLFQSPAFRRQVSKIAQGAKVLGISPNSIKGIQLRIPPLPEQRRIATFLRALDARIGLVERQLAGAEAFKRGLLQGMFV